jgi:hypothetical protein
MAPIRAIDNRKTRTIVAPIIHKHANEHIVPNIFFHLLFFKFYFVLNRSLNFWAHIKAIGSIRQQKGNSIPKPHETPITPTSIDINTYLILLFLFLNVFNYILYFHRLNTFWLMSNF